MEYENAYDRCLGCSYLGSGCDGPNTLSMSLERWCEWCHDLKTLRGWTNLELSEASGVSLTTVDRIMAGKASKDIYRSTCADITRALIGTWGQHPCSLTASQEQPAYQDRPETLRELAEKREELAQLLETVDRLREAHTEEVRKVREEAQKKVDFLKDECAKKDKLIAKLVGM